MRQKYNEYTEGISERLDSALLNLNMVGGNMNPEELQYKEKVINTSRSDKDTDVTVEDKLTGTLLIKSASDNKYGDLKRWLINSITLGHNRYTYIKADTYTIFYKYIPERIKNKNK